MRKMQRWDHCCLVILEYWSSWAFALQSLGVKKLETWMLVAPAGILSEVWETHVGGTMRNGDETALKEDAAQGKWNGWFCFLQGSPSFVNKVRGILQGVTGAMVFGIVVTGNSKVESEIEKLLPWPHGSSVTVKHSQAGGVTRGKWKVFSDLKLQGLKSSQVKRVLGNISVATEAGVKVSADHVGKHSLFTTKDQRINIR